MKERKAFSTPLYQQGVCRGHTQKCSTQSARPPVATGPLKRCALNLAHLAEMAGIRSAYMDSVSGISIFQYVPRLHFSTKRKRKIRWETRQKPYGDLARKASGYLRLVSKAATCWAKTCQLPLTQIEQLKQFGYSSPCSSGIIFGAQSVQSVRRAFIACLPTSILIASVYRCHLSAPWMWLLSMH